MPNVQWYNAILYSDVKKMKKNYTIIVASMASLPAIVLGKGDYPTLFLSSTI